MIVYLYVLGFLLFTIFISYIRKEFAPTLLILSFAVLWFISAFRGVDVGTDTSSYKALFDYYDETDFQDIRGEYLFSLLFYIIKTLGGNYRIFLMVSSLIFYLPVYFAIKKNSTSPMLSLLLLYLLGFCFMFFNISRQMLAVSLSLLAFIACYKNHIKSFLSIVFLCSIIHTTAIFLLFIWFVKKINISSDKYIVLLLFTFLIPFIVNTSYLVETILQYIPLVNKYSSYFDDESDKSIFSINRFLLNLLFIFILISSKKGRASYWISATVWGIIILNLFPTNSVVSRVYYYFSITQIFSLLEVYRRNQQNRLVVITYSFAIFLFYLYSNVGQFIPYVLSFED